MSFVELSYKQYERKSFRLKFKDISNFNLHEIKNVCKCKHKEKYQVYVRSCFTSLILSDLKENYKKK